MKEEEVALARKYSVLLIIAIFIILCYLMLKPYFVALVSAFVLAYMAKPLYKQINKTLAPSISAGICVLAATLIVLIPGALLFKETIVQASKAFNAVTLGEINQLFSSLSQTNVLTSLNIDLTFITQSAVSLLVKSLTNTITQLPSLAINLFITIFGMYYILMNWEVVSTRLQELIPTENKKGMAEEIAKASNEIIFGTVLIAIIQFAVASIAFFLLGLPYYILLGALIGVFAFIPGIGPGFIWVPAAIYYALVGSYMTALIIVLIGGLIIGFGIDTILRAKLTGTKSRINPFIMLIGIFGGISVFGIFGFIVGPLVLIYTIRVCHRIMKDRAQ